MVQESDFDLILLDIMMPIMDGFQVANSLQLNPRTKQIPIIFITALSERDDILQGFQSGASDYIIKPFHSAELLARVATHVKLRQHEIELAAANQVKDKFLHIMAHDLRSPLDGIVSLMNLILDDWEDQTLEDLKPILDSLNLASKAGLALTHELLDWAKMQTGHMEINILPIDLGPILQEAFDLLIERANQKGLTLEHRTNGLKVMADRQMLATILRNLLNNAIKFSHGDKRIQVVVEPQGANVEIKVQDQGVGIPPDQQLKLFRLDKPYTTRGTEDEKGSGLGLILCKEFAEAMKGGLGIESQVGVGSTFTVILPSCQD